MGLKEIFKPFLAFGPPWVYLILFCPLKQGEILKGVFFLKNLPPNFTIFIKEIALIGLCLKKKKKTLREKNCGFFGGKGSKKEGGGWFAFLIPCSLGIFYWELFKLQREKKIFKGTGGDI